MGDLCILGSAAYAAIASVHLISELAAVEYHVNEKFVVYALKRL